MVIGGCPNLYQQDCTPQRLVSNHYFWVQGASSFLRQQEPGSGGGTAVTLLLSLYCTINPAMCPTPCYSFSLVAWIVPPLQKSAAINTSRSIQYLQQDSAFGFVRLRDSIEVQYQLLLKGMLLSCREGDREGTCMPLACMCQPKCTSDLTAAPDLELLFLDQNFQFEKFFSSILESPFSAQYPNLEAGFTA